MDERARGVRPDLTERLEKAHNRRRPQMGIMQWFFRGQRAMYQAKTLQNTSPDQMAQRAKYSFLSRLFSKMSRR